MKRSARVLLLGILFALLAAACGGGDDETTDASGSGSETSEETEQVDNSDWCVAYVTAQDAVIGVSAGGDPSSIPPLLDQVETDPPEEIADSVAEFVPQIRDALETQDESVFQSEEFTAADEELDSYVADNCGFESVDVSAVDYAFEGVPTTLAAGETNFRFTNDGEEVHEMILIRYLDENTKLEDLLEMSDKEAQEKIQFVAASFGPPGTEDVETVPLESGKYAMVCFVPVGATDIEALESGEVQGPPHVTEGMSTEFTVE